MTVPTLTDPNELLEIWTEDGKPTGQGAKRGDIHLQGIWHQAFFCWVARPAGGEPEILLQHRASTKDAYPDCFDSSCGGHMRLGESMGEAVRELQEELGLPDQLEDLVALGTHRQEHLHANGLIDREHHALHILARKVDDAELHPDPVEVQGLAWVPGPTLIELVEGHRTEAEVSYLKVADDRTVSPMRRKLQASEIVPYDGAYHKRIVVIAEAILRDRGLLYQR